MNSIFEAYNAVRSDEQVQLLLELNWKNAAAGALIGAAALTSPLAVGTANAGPATTINQAEKDIDTTKLLQAIRHVESSNGMNTGTRYEAGVEKYLKNTYNNQDKRVQDAINKYGYKAVATSYGPYQVLASTAYWLGFNGNIEDLKSENVSKEYAQKYLNWIIKRPKTKTLGDVISAYNAGVGGIGTNQNYVNKVMKYYR